MYQDFYSFSAMPFQLTPDSRFYFGSNEHRKAMAFLQYGLSQQEGFVVVTGEIGAGKTILVEHLLSTIDQSEYVTARIVTTQLGGHDTLSMIASAFGIPNERMDKSSLITRIRLLFQGFQSQGKHPVVIVDEAQSLTLEAIEELRMLSNLSVGPRAPFQGIFLGQPEFRMALGRPELQQLRQRVIASCHLGALGADDTRKYIEHRLTRVGWVNDPSFSNGAFEEIHRYSGGIPRRINSLCSRLLLLGFLEEQHAISASIVAKVAREMVAELGMAAAPQEMAPGPGTAGSRQELPQAIPEDPVSTEKIDDLRSRLARIERVTDRHGSALVRVLDLALKFLPERE
jgi:putative secretion ATPase (PEP-CTERM system associated)